MELKDLTRMTVVKLREEAAKFPDIVGTHGMTKEQLIGILCEKHNIPRKKTVPQGIGRRALKAKIRALAATRDEVIAGGDRKKIRIYRGRLKAMRRRLRKVIELAEHGRIKTPGKETPGA